MLTLLVVKIAHFFKVPLVETVARLTVQEGFNV